MNLEQMRKQFSDYIKSIDEFGKKENATADEIKANDDVIAKAKALKAEIETAETRQKDMGELRTFATTPAEPAPIVAKSGTTPNGEGSTKGKFGVEEFDYRKDGTFGLVYTDDPLWGHDDVMKKAGTYEYRKAFALMIKGGKDPYRHLDRDEIKLVEEIQRKTAQIGVDEDGGFFSPPQVLNEIVRQDPGETAVTNLVRKQPTTSAAVSMLRMEDSGSDVYTNSRHRIRWTGEGNDPYEETQAKLKPFTIQVHEGEIEVPLTRTFMEDAPGAIESYINSEVRTSFNLGTEDVILGGNGIAKPFGITSRIGEVFGPSALNIGNPVTAAGLLAAYYGLPAQYRRRSSCRIAMRSDVFGDLQGIEDGAGNFIFGLQATYDGLAVSAKEVFRGTPIVFTDFTADSGSGNDVAIHGDFSTYMMAIRLGLTMRVRDIAGQQPAVVFRFRFGGDLMMGRGLKVWRQS